MIKMLRGGKIRTSSETTGTATATVCPRRPERSWAGWEEWGTALVGGWE